MKMPYLLILLSFGCGKESDFTTHYYGTNVIKSSDCSLNTSVEKTVNPLTFDFVKDFFNEANERKVKCFVISQVDILPPDQVISAMKDPEAIGYCNLDTKFIGLSQDFWDSATDTSRTILAFHELGHCALGLNHAPLGSRNIMNPYILPDSFFLKNKDMLLNKLFSRSLL